jgi:hypothetical protein
MSKDNNTKLNNIIEKSYIENFVKFVVNMFNIEYGVNVRAIKGNDDKKVLKIPSS